MDGEMREQGPWEESYSGSLESACNILGEPLAGPGGALAMEPGRARCCKNPSHVCCSSLKPSCLQVEHVHVARAASLPIGLSRRSGGSDRGPLKTTRARIRTSANVASRVVRQHLAVARDASSRSEQARRMREDKRSHPSHSQHIWQACALKSAWISGGIPDRAGAKRQKAV